MSGLERVVVKALNWRVAKADPYGAVMWFDPAIEQPLIGRLDPPSDSDFAPAAAGEQGNLELSRSGGGSSLEGGAADEKDRSNPIVSEEAPQEFLSSIWEGGCDGES